MRAVVFKQDKGRMVVRCLFFLAGWSLLGPQIFSVTGEVTDTNVQTRSVGDKVLKLIDEICDVDDDCIDNSKCSTSKKCECDLKFPVRVENQCVASAAPGEACFHSNQCKYFKIKAQCEKDKCVCDSGYKIANFTNNTITCIAARKKAPDEEEGYVDPTMLGVLIGLSVMFIVMCVVLRMFSKARFRENRTIFNSPRLMKLSLANKRAERRPSHASLGGGSRPGSRAGSRHPSIQSGLNFTRSSPTNSHKGSHDSLTAQLNCVNVKPGSGSPVKQEPLIRVDSPKEDKRPMPSDNIASV